MNCRDAEKYMMKYMDGEMSLAEAAELQVHVSECPICACAFQIYDHMLEEFESYALMEAPEGFEGAVMARVTQLEPDMIKVEYSIKDRVWGHVFGTFTVLFGTGAIVAFYRQPILKSLSQNPYLSSHIKALQPVEQEIAYQMSVVSDMVNESFSVLNHTISNSAGIIFIVLSVVCFLQYYMIRRRKKKSLVERK